ncbi:restriction endonuclease subunit S [Xanthomonas campestris pv. raphani]|uniref:restriction endonuclease subunit S n=1 Tax=Xanthomonas campestris TaxID=339 RepID=UPI002B22A17A|nr:restriction endonuclease subunit S [Xanthomonas campestris]MEA9654516.1 restriction endonuclease subunit S [Xanthomonas campestris pv. raphani]
MSYFAGSDQLPAWVGKPPKEWKTDWLKWHVSLSTERPDEEQQSRLPYLSNEDIASWTGKLLREELEPSEADSRLFHSGDVLFNKLRPYLAKVFSANFDGVSSGELLCLRPSERVDARYLFYVLTSFGFIDAVDSQTFGSKMPRADWETVGHQPLPLPRIEIQQRIARFLDDKTARIDALIEKKQALLERLAEKRQALITCAVTKGLNPGMPMKPSGVDWIGDVPERWMVAPVKRIAKLESGHTPDKKVDEYWQDCDIPWVSLNDTDALRSGDYIDDTAFKINELGLANSSARMLPPRAVVFTRDATIGESAITTRSMAVSQHIIAWICDVEMMVPEYLLFAIYSMTQELMRLTNGSTIGTIGLTDVKSIHVPVPTIDEQRAIVRHVSEGKEHVGRIIVAAQSSIDTLREYRSALITAAVTGQISEISMETLAGSDS